VILSKIISNRILEIATEYLGRDFDYEKFNCVHYVREVYFRVGIVLPILVRGEYPPPDFHLSHEEFSLMPLGHSVFFKRKTSMSDRYWTHVGIIFSTSEIIHCSWIFGDKVVITSLPEFFEVYDLAPKPLR